jgi:hypothetical protein
MVASIFTQSAAEVTIVSPKIPSYLKLHVENTATVHREPRDDIPGLSRLRDAFHRATGLALEFDKDDSGAGAMLRVVRFDGNGTQGTFRRIEAAHQPIRGEKTANFRHGRTLRRR